MNELLKKFPKKLIGAAGKKKNLNLYNLLVCVVFLECHPNSNLLEYTFRSLTNKFEKVFHTHCKITLSLSLI